jgi:hypothetical protein
MSNFAHIINGIVDNVIIADASFISSLDNAKEWVDVTGLSVGVGYNYNGILFYAPQPYISWTLDENLKWIPPIEMPLDNQKYNWDEDNQKWVVVPPKVKISRNLNATNSQ